MPTSNLYNYSPSVNILRDREKSLNYIPTYNSQIVWEQIVSNYSKGIRAFTIVGAYGTGKSAFFWAFQKSIESPNTYFSRTQESTLFSFKNHIFLNLIGDYMSFSDAISSQLENVFPSEKPKILQRLDEYANKLSSEGQALVIIVDEFGKYLEYAAKNNPEYELYFLQQFAEYINNNEKNILFLSTLHQDFNAYSFSLTESQRNEWTKVKGRLKEITFNEPVEQLLFLASERLNEKGDKEALPKNGKDLFLAIQNAKAFPLRDYFTEEVATKLYPFDILAAAILTISLQKYAQNERSLFSFIESNDHLGINSLNPKEGEYYNISDVYDYLFYTYPFITHKQNPDFGKWAMIRVAIEKAERFFESDLSDAIKLIKTIGLLNIFGTNAANMLDDFLCEYAKHALSIKNPITIISKLIDYQIIKQRKHAERYVLFEGTDIEIDVEIANAVIDPIENVAIKLKEHFEFPYVAAKASFYHRGTPRFFEFVLTEDLNNHSIEGEIDGVINLIFSHKLTEKNVQEFSAKKDTAILYGFYEDSNRIQQPLIEIEKVKKVLAGIDYRETVAINELNYILDYEVRKLNKFVIGSLYANDGMIKWFFKGKKVEIHSSKTFNRTLSEICDTIYSKTPIFKSELANKAKLSGQISLARKNLLKALTLHYDKKDVGFDEKFFPPEKTIYISLIRETGIHKQGEDLTYNLSEPDDEGLLQLWNTCKDFIQSTKNNRKKVSHLVQLLSAKPYKLKLGFLELFIPVFLFTERNDFALFENDIFIPTLSAETLELITKNPQDFEIKAFNVEGVRLDIFNHYRVLLNQNWEEKPTQQSFIETIKPFITFYKGLNVYTQNTKRLSKDAIAIREAIQKAKDPEEVFFEAFPKALGYDQVRLQNSNDEELSEYIQSLQQVIRELRTCYDELIIRIEKYLQTILNTQKAFPHYRKTLQSRYKEIKTHLLLPHQKVFLQRINTQLDDRNAWIASLSQAILNKPLENIQDEDEHRLYDKLKDALHELDNLYDMSKIEVDEQREEVVSIELTTFDKGTIKQNLRIPVQELEDIKISEAQIKKLLQVNKKQNNLIILARLLKEYL